MLQALWSCDLLVSLKEMKEKHLFLFCRLGAKEEARVDQICAFPDISAFWELWRSSSGLKLPAETNPARLQAGQSA